MPQSPRGAATERRARAVLGDDPKHVAEKPGRRPARQAETAARAAHAAQFGRGPPMIRREHHAERREHDIEARVRVGQRFGVVGLFADDEEAVRFAREIGGLIDLPVDDRRHVERESDE